MLKMMAIQEDVKARLDSLKLCPDESYNSLIIRLIERHERLKGLEK